MATGCETSLTTSDITECLICQEVIKERSVLSCLHTVCVQCLNNSYSSADNKRDQEVECPLCSRIFLIPSDGIINDSTNNFFLNQLLEVSKPNGLESLKKPTLCDWCSRSEAEIQSTSFCIDCDQRICDRCDEIHNKIKSAKSHQVMRGDDHNKSPQAVRDDYILSAQELSYCDQHPSEEKRLYCYDCKMIMCHKCVSKPNKHSLADAKRSMKTFREQLQENVDEVSAYTYRRQEEIVRLETDKNSFMKNVDATRREISQKYEQLIDLIQTQQNQLMKELNSFKDKVLKEIGTKKDEIEKQFPIRENFKKCCLAMMNKGITCDISRTARDLHARAEELVKTQDEPGGYKLSQVEIMFKPSFSNADGRNNFIGELVFNDTRCEPKKSQSTLTDKYRLLHVETNPCRISGVTVLGGEFFVVRKSSHVYVYNCDTFELIRELQITGSAQLKGIVSCALYKCLYVIDIKQDIIYRYDVTSGMTSKWLVKVPWHALSVNKGDHNVLATLRGSVKTIIQEYTTFGSLVRVINLDCYSSGILYPQHCVQLSSGYYVLSQSNSRQHLVSVVDRGGRIVQSFGGPRGSGRGLLDQPRQLAVDMCNNVLVADYMNNRLQLLSPTLSYLGSLEIPEFVLREPNIIYLDEQNHRLYVVLSRGDRLCVLGADFNNSNC